MAIGDKRPVVMASERAVANGVATLDSQGVLSPPQRPTADALLMSDGRTVEEAISNPDLLINADFRNPVNRNGKINYTGNGLTQSFTIDRWKANNLSDVSLESNGIKLSFGDVASWKSFTQRLNPDDLLTGPLYTFSILYKTSMANLKLAIEYKEGYSEISNLIPPSEGWNVFSVTAGFSHQLTTPRVLIVNDGTAVSGNIQIQAAKLEMGSTQTLAHKEDEIWMLNDPPNYDLQYLLSGQYSPITGEWVGSQHSNPNLLDNWYFAGGGSQQGGGEFPINQRTKLVYSETKMGYTVDRWRFNDGTTNKLEVKSDCITFSSTGTAFYKEIAQVVENYKSLIGKTITYSALVRSSQNGILFMTWDTSKSVKKSIPASEDWVLVTHSMIFPSDATNKTRFGFMIDTGLNGSVDILAAKLELGPVSTLAHKEGDTWVLNDPAPNYALELQKCQRYFLNIYNIYAAGHIGNGNPKLSYNLVPIPTSLRKKPSLAVESIGQLYTEAGIIVPSDIVVYNCYPNGVLVQLTHAGTITAGSASVWGDASVSFSSEL